MRPRHLLCWLHALTLQCRPKPTQNPHIPVKIFSISNKSSNKTKQKKLSRFIHSINGWVQIKGMGGEVWTKQKKLPWNVDWELVLTAELWETVGMDTEAERDWGREEEEEDRPAFRERDEGWTWLSCEERWKLEEGKTLTGPWTKSLKSSQSSEKPALGAEDEGWAWAWVEKPKVEEVDEEEDVGKEAGAPKGPWKSLNSSLSSHKAGGREWVVTEGCDGDDSAKMKK